MKHEFRDCRRVFKLYGKLVNNITIWHGVPTVLRLLNITDTVYLIGFNIWTSGILFLSTECCTNTWNMHALLFACGGLYTYFRYDTRTRHGHSNRVYRQMNICQERWTRTFDKSNYIQTMMWLVSLDSGQPQSRAGNIVVIWSPCQLSHNELTYHDLSDAKLTYNELTYHDPSNVELTYIGPTYFELGYIELTMLSSRTTISLIPNSITFNWLTTNSLTTNSFTSYSITSNSIPKLDHNLNLSQTTFLQTMYMHV